MELFEIISKVVHVFLFSGGVTFNGLLIWLILFKTPKAFRPYSVIILNHAITDIVGCFSDFYVQGRVVPTDWTLAYAVNGFCQYISSWSCDVGFSLQLHSFSHSLYLLLICFTYRYLIIIRKIPSFQVLLCAIFIAWIPSIAQTICLIIDSARSEVIEAIVKKRHPHYIFNEKQLFGGYVSLFNPLTAYAIFHTCLAPTPIYISILILRKKIMEVLNMSACHMGDQTKDMHRQLLKALTIQAALPVLNLAAVIIFFTGQFDLYHHPILEYNNLVVVQIVPATTPLISLIYIRPYRQVAEKLINRHLFKKAFIQKASLSSIRDNTNSLHISTTFI